jgi:hypothetical protein
MKNSVKTLVVFGCTFAVSATLFGQALPTLTFDENGNGNFNGSPLPYTVAPDPSGGIAANVLIYQLPFAVTPGDVALVELDKPTAVFFSDLIRFLPSAGGAQSLMIFYSDLDDASDPDSLADTGLPPAPNAIPINEVGPEGNNGAKWLPTPGQPGSTSVPVQYNFISDVPEPGASALCGLGFLFVVNRFRRNGVLNGELKS